MSRLRPGAALLAAVILACGTLAAARARPAKYGGVLVVGMSSGDADSLDPRFARNTAALLILDAMCQKLYTNDARLEPVPLLAAALPVPSKDKLTYTIQLQREIQFNDGTPFDAQSVVATVERYMTDYPGSPASSDYSDVDSVNASGPYTVVYRLKERDSSFIGGNPYILSPTQLTKLGDNFASEPVCVGPFMFDHRVVGDNVTLVKSPFYYDQKDVFLDKLVYKPMPDAAAALAALTAGDIQALSEVSTTQVAAVKQSSSLRLLTAPQLGWIGITINIGNRNGVGSPYGVVDAPLARSAKLRQAFEEAIDRDAMNRVVFNGLMQVSCTPIPPADTPWYAATVVPCTPYDPAHARKLVAASGVPNPTVHLLTTNPTDFVRLSEFIQAQEAAVGINVVIDVADSATANSRTNSGSFEARLKGLIPGQVDPGAGLVRRLASFGSTNASGYSSPRLDLILANGVKATSVTARSTLYRVAQQIIHDDRPIIVLYNAVTFAAFGANVAGVRLSYNGRISVENAQFR